MPPLEFDTKFLDDLAPSVAHLFMDRVATSGGSEAFRYPVGDSWKSLTWKQAGDLVSKYAAGLLALGLEPEQRVGIASTTRYEWILADLAVMCAGGATTTVYPTTNAEDTAYILADSDSRVVFAENDDQIAKLKERKSELPAVTKVVTFDGAGDGDWVIGLDELADMGAKHLAEKPGAVESSVAAIGPDQLATLIYTSGTTGRPKGVRLLHRAWVYEGAAIKAQGILDETDLQFLWLPLAHSFGKVLQCVQLSCGFPTAVDGRVDKIVDNVGVVRPTFMGAAPRIFEKAHGKIVTMTEAEGGVKEKLFKQAFKVGLKVDELESAGKPVPLPLRLQHGLFDKLVFSKVRDRFGGRIRFFISGSAALNPEIAAWFNAAGLVILEGYGMTENAAGAAVNHPEQNKIGTVGAPFPGSEITIGENDEVLIRGPHVMAGYHNLPEETAKTLDDDGWLHTGDQGRIDEDGHVVITGRIKELFKTSGGKYISPPLIESKFKAICPFAGQFLVFGNERNYCVALITLDEDGLLNWAHENGKSGSYAELVASEEIQEKVAGYVEELNSRLNRWETIKKWELLDHDFTVESGELTPSMKVKRNVVENNYQDKIDAMYA